MKPRNQTLLPLASFSSLALFAGSAALHAQTAWDGGGGNTDYSNNLNWAGDIIPGNGNANGALIGSSSTQTVIYNTATSYTSTGTGKANSLLVGTGTAGNGSLTLSGSAGTLTFGGDAYNNAAWIGSAIGNSNATGSVTVSAGKLAIGTGAGSDASINLGVWISGTAGGIKNGTLTINGGTVEVGRRILMGANATTTVGLLTLSSGTLDMKRTGSNGEGDLGMIRFGTGNNTVNLDGGTAILTGFHISGATNARSNIYFNGTTLKANATNTDFFLGTTANANLQIKNNGLIFDTNTFAVTINDALSNFSGHTGFLTKQGAGTLTLSSGASSYTGNISITGGTLLATGTTGGINPTTSALGNPQTASRTITVGSGAILSFGNNDILGNDASTPVVKLIANSGTITNNGAFFTTLGSVDLNGSTINSTGGAAPASPSFFLKGTITVGGSAVSTISGSGTNSQMTLASPTTFHVADATTSAASDLNVSVVLQGGGLTKTGVGTMTLSGANTYTGATLISGGTLTLSGSGAVNSSSGLTVNGSSAKLLQTSSAASTPAITLTQGTLDGTGTVGAVTVGNGTGGIVTNGNGTTSTLTLGSLAFGGAGTLTLNKANDTSTVALAITGALATTPANGQITLNVTTAPIWTLGTPYNMISYGSFAGADSDFTVGSIAGLATRQSASVGNTGAGNGFITITINGDNPVWTGANGGIWTTAVTNSPTGATPSWALSNAHTTTDFWAGDTAEFNDTVNIDGNTAAPTTTTVTIQGGNVSPTSAIFNNSTLDYTITSTDGSGIATGFVTLNGTGQVALNTANSYTGATLINAGTLNLNGSLTGGTAIATSGTGLLNQSATGEISNAGSFAQGSSGTSILAGVNSYTGATTVSAGTLSLTGSLAGSNVTTSGTGIVSEGASGVIAGSGVTFTQNSSGTSTLAGTNTYTGATTLSSGTLIANSATTPFGTAASALNLNGGTLGLQEIGTTYNTTVGGTTTIESDNASSGPGTNKTLGTLSIGAFQLNVAPGANATGSTAAITFGATTLTGAPTFDIAANSTLNLGAVGGSVGFTKQNTGTLILTGVNTFTGPISATGGTIELSSLAGTAAITLDAATLSTTASLSTARPIALTAGGGTVQVATGTTLTATGAMSGIGSLTKTGEGTLTLTAGSTRTAPVSINAGTLIVSGAGSLGTGATTVSGSGSILNLDRNDTWGSHSASVQALTIQSGGLVTNGTLTTRGFNAVQTLALDGGELRVTGTARALVDGDLRKFEAYAISDTITVTGSVASSITNPTSITNAGINIGGFTNLGGGVGSALTFNVADVTSSSAADLTVSAVLKNNYTSVSFTPLTNGLVKTGSGTLELSAVNRYSGNTTVNEGTLVLADNAQLRFVLGAASGTNNSLTGAGTVTLNGDFFIDTSAADALASGTWTLENVPTLSGAYGSTFSVVGFTATGDKWTKDNGLTKRYTFDEETGILTLGPIPAGYSTWASTNAPNTDPDEDEDGDGVINSVEYVLGGAITTNDLDKLPEVSTTPGGDMLFSFDRDQDSIDGTTTVTIEVGTTLVTWPDSYSVPGPAQAIVPGVTVAKDTSLGFDTVTLNIVRAPDTAKFARLKVVVTP